jgi:hypothetical protein
VIFVIVIYLIYVITWRSLQPGRDAEKPFRQAEKVEERQDERTLMHGRDAIRTKHVVAIREEHVTEQSQALPPAAGVADVGHKLLQPSSIRGQIFCRRLTGSSGEL